MKSAAEIQEEINQQLRTAAAGLDLAGVKAGIAAGGDTSYAIGEDQWAALHLAAIAGERGDYAGAVAVVTELLKAGANLEQTDSRGRTCFYFAARYGVTDLVEFLVGKANMYTSNNYGETGLHKAVSREDAGTVKLLLDAGFDPDFPDSRGGTPKGAAEAARNPEIPPLFNITTEVPATRRMKAKDAKKTKEL